MAAQKKSPDVILGTMTFGSQVDEKTAEGMAGMFFDAGHVRLDTAYRYNDGKTEKILGRILKRVPRDKFIIDSKAHPGDGGGLAPRRLAQQLESSLMRLNIDHVDLFYLHAPDSETPLAVTLDACQTLYRQGKFRQLGLSNYPSWQAADAWHVCRANGWILPTVYQGMYNAVTRAIEAELLTALKNYCMRFYAYNPLAGGLLTGKYEEVEKLPDAGRFALLDFYQDRYWKERYFAALENIREAVDGAGLSMAEAALRWICHGSSLSAEDGDGIILGASGIEQLASNINAIRQGANPPEVASAFDDAWAIARPDCPTYFR